jgi:TPR repeat protein
MRQLFALLIWLSTIAAITATVLCAQDGVSRRLDSLETAANAGDHSAQAQCALMYWWGIGRANNSVKACQWAASAAEGDALASYIYAQCLVQTGTMPDRFYRADSIAARALAELRRRATQGDSYALVALSECYQRGCGGVVPSDDSARMFLAEALRLGNPLAAYELSRREHGNRRTELLHDAVRGGVLHAMVELAQYHLVRGDTLGALALLRDADERGSPEAALLLAGFASSGIGMTPSPTQSLRWLASAADRGNALAKFELGYRMLYGIGVAADTTEALAWMLAAVASAPQQKRPTLVHYLETLLDSIPSVAKHLEAASARLAAIQGAHPDSSERMALLTGDGVRVWRAWYRQSSMIPSIVLMRHDEHGALAFEDAFAEQEWKLLGDSLVLWNETSRHAAHLEFISEGLSVFNWSGKRMLASPMLLWQLKENRRLSRHPMLRPTVEMLPPRVGERAVQLRLHARNIPSKGLTMLPIGIAPGRSAHRAEVDVRAKALWRVWYDGEWTLRWEPEREDIPKGWRGKCVLFVQCMWQFEGEDETMVVRSQAFDLPPRLLR